jgi:hypothetical protein
MLSRKLPPSGRANVATNDPQDSSERPMSENGGCLNLGWGCLPVLIATFGFVPLLTL